MRVLCCSIGFCSQNEDRLCAFRTE